LWDLLSHALYIRCRAGPSARELSSTPLPQQLLVVCSQGGDAEHLYVDFVMLVANFIFVVICIEKFADIAFLKQFTYQLPNKDYLIV